MPEFWFHLWIKLVGDFMDIKRRADKVTNYAPMRSVRRSSARPSVCP